MNIPDHVRRNHEATEDKLHRLGALLTAIDQMLFEAEIPANPQSQALSVLFDIVKDTQREACRAHLAEWVGHGGCSNGLTEAETAAARGETERAAA